MWRGLHNRVSSWLCSAPAEYHLAGTRAPHHHRKVLLRLKTQLKCAHFDPWWEGFLAPRDIELTLSDTSRAMSGLLPPDKRTYVCTHR